MLDNWFSVTGSKELLDSVVRLIWYRNEERDRLRGEAMAAEGKGYQEILRAADMVTTVEQNRLAFIQKKAEMMRALGMSEEALAIMSQGEMTKLDHVGRDIEILRLRSNLGDLQGARVEELSPGPDVEER